MAPFGFRKLTLMFTCKWMFYMDYFYKRTNNVYFWDKLYIVERRCLPTALFIQWCKFFRLMSWLLKSSFVMKILAPHLDLATNLKSNWIMKVSSIVTKRQASTVVGCQQLTIPDKLATETPRIHILLQHNFDENNEIYTSIRITNSARQNIFPMGIQTFPIGKLVFNDNPDFT